MTHDHVPDPQPTVDPDEEARERYRELLEELRTIIPGVQVLFGFLLTVPFSARFDRLDDLGRDLYSVVLAGVALAIVVFLTPAAIHRFGADGRTAVNNQTVRSVFIISPDKKVQAMLTYPMSSGRNFDEILRLLDSLQMVANNKVATPVNWRPGDDVIIPPSVSDEDAKARFPEGFKTLKPYLRVVKQP